MATAALNVEGPIRQEPQRALVVRPARHHRQARAAAHRGQQQARQEEVAVVVGPEVPVPAVRAAIGHAHHTCIVHQHDVLESGAREQHRARASNIATSTTTHPCAKSLPLLFSKQQRQLLEPGLLRTLPGLRPFGAHAGGRSKKRRGSEPQAGGAKHRADQTVCRLAAAPCAHVIASGHGRIQKDRASAIPRHVGRVWRQKQ